MLHQKKILYISHLQVSSIGRNAENKPNMRMDNICSETDILKQDRASLKIVFTTKYVTMVNMNLASLNLDPFL